jgi:hypothetical protein
MRINMAKLVILIAHYIQETWQCHETRFLIITIVDKYVVFEIQIQATNNVTMCNVKT